MYHALFDIEDFHGLHPVQIDGRFYLEFSGPVLAGDREADQIALSGFLRSWSVKREECLPAPGDSKETLMEKRKKYDLWRYEYPMNEARDTHERLRMLRKKQQLEKELRELNDQLGS